VFNFLKKKKSESDLSGDFPDFPKDPSFSDAAFPSGIEQDLPRPPSQSTGDFPDMPKDPHGDDMDWTDHAPDHAAPPSAPAMGNTSVQYQQVDTSDVDDLFHEEKIEPPRAEDFSQPYQKTFEGDDEFELPDFDDKTIEKIEKAKKMGAEVPIHMQKLSAKKSAKKPEREGPGFFTGKPVKTLKPTQTIKPFRHVPSPEIKEKPKGELYVSTEDYKKVLWLIDNYDKNINEFEEDYLELLRGIQKQKNSYQDLYKILDSVQEDFVEIDKIIFGD
jgi:hypothetical protein